MKKSLLTLISLLLISCGQKSESQGATVAKVEGSVLSESDIDKILLSSQNDNFTIEEAVGGWVNREVLYTAARKSGFENDEVLNSQIEDYRKKLYGNYFLENYLSSQIKIEETNIQEYYKKNRSTFRRSQGAAKIRHFFLTSSELSFYLADALKQSSRNVDRKELLANFNAEITTAEKGGLINELDKVVFSNNRSNKVIGPIRSNFGYHIVEILDRYPAGSYIDIEDVHGEIYQRLYNQKKSISSVQVLDSLRNTYSVKINIEKYK